MSSYWTTSPTSSPPLARRRATVSSTLSTVNMTLRRPRVFGGAIAGSISTSFGLRNFVSSSRPCPSGVRIITMSTWTLSSPLTRSTHGPSIGISPSSVMPRAVKKAIAAARSSTTTLTWSNLLIVISPVLPRPCARSRPTVLASWTRLAEETQKDEGAAKLHEVILPKDRDPRFITIRRGGTLTDSDHRLLAFWAAACAEHVLHLFEAVQPSDPRPREAIEQIRAWARAAISMSQSRPPGGHPPAPARQVSGGAPHAAYAAGQAAVGAHVAAPEPGASAYAIKAVRAAA